MTIINQKSISGITSITTAAAGDNLLTVHTNDGTERLRIDSSGNTRITAGIVTTLSATGDVDIADKIVHTGDTNTAIRFPAADTITAETGGSERLRITSDGNIGIGNNNPGDFRAGAENLVVGSGSGAEGMTIYSATNASGRICFADGSGASDEERGVIQYAHDDNHMQFDTNATERLRIDSSGRVMLGTTTPGPTAGEQLTIEDSANAGITIRSGTSAGGAILFEDDTADRGEIQYSHNGDFLRIKTAGSERLRIDSSGRVIIADNDTNNAATYADDLVIGTTSGDRGMTIVSQNVNAGSINFSDGTSADEKSRGIIQYDHGGDFMRWYVDSVERLRINNLGFVKAGPRITDSSHGVASLTSARHEFTSDNNGWTIIVTHTSGAASEHEGILIDYENSPNGTGNSFLQGNDSNGTRFRMASNGGLYNYQSNNSNLSDEREKKNIVSLDTKWDKVKSWELKKFHYNEDADSDDLRYGVIAQQVEEHCPEVLSEWVKQEAKDAVLDGDGNVVTPAQAEVVRKGVKEQQMMWMAIKALQEAQTRIETLETQNTAQQTQINDLITRVTALEG